MSKTQEALKLALEALEETRNALAWFYDSYPEDVTPKGNELLPHVEVVLADLRVALTSNSRALEQPAQQDYWQEEARRYAQNADFWRGKYESATAQRQEPVATLWQHGETERTRITMPGDITDCDARWFKVSDLYTTPQPAYVATPRVPERKPLTDEQLYKVFPAIASYTEANKTLYRSIARAIEAAHGIKEKNT